VSVVEHALKSSVLTVRMRFDVPPNVRTTTKHTDLAKQIELGLGGVIESFQTSESPKVTLK